MASVSTDGGGNRRILFTHPDGRRKTVYLGPVPKKLAEAVKLRVEALVGCLAAKLPPDLDTAAWTAGVGDDLAAKLAAVGLVAERRSETLGAFLNEYTDRRRADSKGGTVITIERVAADLTGFYGPAVGLRDITEKRADDFRTHYLTRAPKLAPATVHRRLKTARMFFAFAVRMKLVAENPFRDVSAPNALPAEKRHYVSVADAERLLDVCNPTWRAIVALARFGGLRCPNEVLSLRWEHVDFAAGRMTVTSAKTEHHEGKGYRVVPLFPRLRAVLDEAWELAPVGAEYVVGGEYRAKSLNGTVWNSVNLRTQFHKLIRRAGLMPWPRPFNNCRASCETDLNQSFPSHVVCEWVGHSPAVAATHYLTVRESDFDVAVRGNAPDDAPTTRNTTRPGADANRLRATKNPEPLAGVRVSPLVSSADHPSLDDLMTLWGCDETRPAAVAAYQRAVEHDPTDGPAWFRLGVCLRRRSE